MFGLPPVPWGQLSIAGMEPNVRNNDQGQMSALTDALAAAHAQNSTPNGRVARGFNQFAPLPSGIPAPMLETPPTPAPVDTSKWPALSAQALAPASPTGPAGPLSVGGAPLPNVGPTSVGGAPLGSQGPFAGPNSVGGAPLSGTSDQWASLGPQQSSGPDVIQKLMSYFGNKDNPSST